MGLKVGILGFGHLGRHLYDAAQAEGAGFEIAFLWNRNEAALKERGVPPALWLDSLDNIAEKVADVVVEARAPPPVPKP